MQIGLAGRIRVHVERAATDLGLRDACQRALRFTLGDYVALLNNDCIVTSGWLNQLIGLASFSMTVGLAGPMSNMAAPPQLIEPVPYRSSADPGIGSSEALIEVAAVERYAAEFHQQQKGNWMYASGSAASASSSNARCSTRSAARWTNGPIWGCSTPIS